MVEDLDPQELTPGDKPACEGDVLGRRLGIATRVVVSEQEGGAAGEDRGLEDFAGLCCGASYVTQRLEPLGALLAITSPTQHKLATTSTGFVKRSIPLTFERLFGIQRHGTSAAVV